MVLDFSTAMLETRNDTESGFQIWRKNDLQPRIRNLANLSSKSENNNILRHAKSQKGDGCRAGIVINPAGLEQGRGSLKRLWQAEEINMRVEGMAGNLHDWKEAGGNPEGYYQS